MTNTGTILNILICLPRETYCNADSSRVFPRWVSERHGTISSRQIDSVLYLTFYDDTGSQWYDTFNGSYEVL